MGAEKPFLRDGTWYVTRERWEAVAPDGSSVNYSVAAPDSPVARRYVAEGCAIVRRVDEVREAPYMQVILSAADGDENAVRLMGADMQRMLNMARDAGRPSDAARVSARAYLNGTLTWESFEASRPSGHYAEDRS